MTDAGSGARRGTTGTLVRTTGTLVGALLTLVLVGLAACTGGTTPGSVPGSSSATSANRSTTTSTGSPSTPAAPTTSLLTTPRPTTSPSSATPPPTTAAVDPADPVDPRWRFYTRDTRTFTSPWFAGSHRIMVPFGCTPAPYYDHDPRCPGSEGFHHGVDVVMPCGTPLTSRVAGVVASPGGVGELGAAYGPWAFRIRDTTDGVDIVIGHVRTVDVRPGDRVAVGQRIALSSDQGAPDGCHLHFEVRTLGGGLGAARDPLPFLRLAPT